MVVDFFRDNCPPCTRLDAETWPDPAVVAELRRFVFVKVDAKVHPEAANRHGVHVSPTVLVLAPDGTEWARRTGFVGPEELARTLAALR